MEVLGGDGGEIVVRRPPQVPKEPPTNLVARLLPVGTLVAMGAMTVLYFSSGAAMPRSPMFLFLPVMMLVSVLGSVAHQSRGARRGGELDQDRRGYLRYLDDLDRTLVKVAEAQHLSLHRRHPDPASSWLLAGSRRRWERRPSDADFCHVRVGVGTVGLAVPLVVPDLGPPEERDPVTGAAVERVVAHRSTVSDAPVTVDLRAHPCLAVDGPMEAARSLVRSMACQLAVTHGPDVVGITAEGRFADTHWDWLKWLPHHRVSHDRDGPRHRLVIVDGEAGGRTPADGETVVIVGGHPAPECVRLDVAGQDTAERPDALTAVQAVVCARALARFRPSGTGTSGWAELVGIGDPARLDPERVWQPRTHRHRLRVAIGVDDLGAPVELDLKEAARGGMGPHGLCVGATGSGKSEFLRTLALGLVATHAPDELNLVLVDFKGGATFLGFERLRHVAAIVTNLSEEAHLVARMHDALAGEMTRRQRLLRTSGGFANARDYAVARAGGAPLAALPALFVVVDEFSELLSQHPDFAELFVAIGRVGRSLGMHLLLASQRLDEGRLRGLETHLSYRVCLKTFSASESRAVLGTSDAYDLPATPGAALLKSASGELIRFRAAYVSGPSAASAGVPVPSRFTAAGPRDEAVATGPTLLETVADTLADRGALAHQVWLPPLDGSPTLGALLTRVPTPFEVPIGLVDNPFGQRRDVLTVDVRGAGGHVAIVGGPRSGKSTALRTLVLGLAAGHDPDAVHVYGLDLGGGSLAALASLPHVGAMAGRSERDLAWRIVSHVHGVVREREAQTHSGRSPWRSHTFLVVDGWSVLRREFDGMEETVTAIAAQGLSVGVHVVVAAARWADLRPALKDQLNTRIELRLGDPADSEMDRKRARLLAGRPAGHGITSEGLEFVIATPQVDGVDASAMARRHQGLAAPAVRLLPSAVPHADVVDGCPEGVTVGLGETDLAPVSVDFTAHPHLLILGDTECGKTAALRTVCHEIVRTQPPEGARIVVVDFRRTLLGVVESEHLLGYAMSPAAAESQLAGAVNLLGSRMPGDGVTQRQLRDRSWWSGPEVYVVVDDYDLVATASGNPVLPLLDLLPHARDLGLHLVVARRSGGAARAMFDPVLTRLRELGCMGLMMSASPDEGVLLGTRRPGPLPAGRGTLIRRGHRDELVQVSWTDPP
ncbi:type VII secretion protein EccCa [Mycolicibacterium sp. 050158]|nr:type VII secretion protein EccCa [Mycolicibacterium sp. 050158]MDX1888351.1 type VII secretion protein EccCa [Mycolicibacterium sp. 050158]